MKRISLLLAMFFLAASLSFAAVTFVTLDWSNTVAGNTSPPSFGTYNFATGHFLVCDYGAVAASCVRIASGTDGALLGPTLNTTGLNMGSLNVFSICATSDGVIYGGTNIKTDGVTEGNSLFRWANEGATPTQQDPADQPLDPLVPMEFARAMDAIGTGADTIIGTTGTDNYMATFLTTLDGTTFAVTDSTPLGGVNSSNLIKQGVALVPGMEKVYGTKADGSGEVVRLDKVGGAWAEHTEWDPPSSYADPPDGLGNASGIGFAPVHNAVIVLGFRDLTNDYITALDGDTGAILVQVQAGLDCANNGYSNIDLDENPGVGYFIGRSGTANSHACGKISFDALVTPIPGAGVDIINWGLYE